MKIPKLIIPNTAILEHLESHEFLNWRKEEDSIIIMMDPSKYNEYATGIKAFFQK
ncbi:MAG: hypothetical protein ACTSRZ_07800 [Promethearchaeota archaeon]